MTSINNYESVELSEVTPKERKNIFDFVKKINFFNIQPERFFFKSR